MVGPGHKIPQLLMPVKQRVVLVPRINALVMTMVKAYPTLPNARLIQPYKLPPIPMLSVGPVTHRATNALTLVKLIITHQNRSASLIIQATPVPIPLKTASPVGLRMTRLPARLVIVPLFKA